jgi:5-methyltetrahydrofolate--homocysteine methyltransferase
MPTSNRSRLPLDDQSGKLVSYEEACANRFRIDWARADIPRPWRGHGIAVLRDYPLHVLVPYLNWARFFQAWEIPGKPLKVRFRVKAGVWEWTRVVPRTGSPAFEAYKLFEDARTLLDRILKEKLLRGAARYGFYPAISDGDDIIIWYVDPGIPPEYWDWPEAQASVPVPPRSRELMRFPMLRQQWQRQGQTSFRCLADYIAPRETGLQDYLGFFVVTAGIGADELAHSYEQAGDPYHAKMLQVLAHCLAEAFAEKQHEFARNRWGYGEKERLSKQDLLDGKYRGIRPAPGDPSCPDPSEKRTLWRMLHPAEHGIHLTENCALLPGASGCGFYFSHPEAKYFTIDRIGRDQVVAYAERKKMPVADVERWLAPHLVYDVE